MEGNYDPKRILMNTFQRFSAMDEYRGSEIHDYQIYIEIKGSEDDRYIIGGYKKDCFLLKYSLRRSSSTITAPKNLYRDRDKLGKVEIKFKKKNMKNYQSYDEFLEDIQAESS